MLSIRLTGQDCRGACWITSQCLSEWGYGGIAIGGVQGIIRIVWVD